MTLARHLTQHLVSAALKAVLVVAAMIDRAVGVGIVIGFVANAVVSAVRGYRKDRQRRAESRDLDTKLSAALDRTRRRGIVVIDISDEEPRYS